MVIIERNEFPSFCDSLYLFYDISRTLVIYESRGIVMQIADHYNDVLFVVTRDISY